MMNYKNNVRVYGRRVALLVLIMTGFLSASAQRSFLGRGENFIKDSLYKNSFVILSRRLIATNTIQVDFGYFETSKYGDHKRSPEADLDIPNDKTPTATLTCIIENEVCTRYIIGYKQVDVPAVLTYLNTRYKKTDTNHWVDAKGVFEADAYPQDDIFAIEFKKTDGN